MPNPALNQEFERQKACYEQNCEHMRRLSQIMYQIPIIAMTLTGGLWYGVATITAMDNAIICALLVLAAVFNLFLILIIHRIRDVMEGYLEKIKLFYSEGFARPSDEGLAGWKRCFKWAFGDRGVCRTFSVMMGIAASMSILGIFAIGDGNVCVCIW